MGQNDENNEVYNNLTEAIDDDKKNKWTLYLLLCCITACLASFQFGYNIGATNLPTPLVKSFFISNYRPVYAEKNREFNSLLKTFNSLDQIQKEIDNLNSTDSADKKESLQENMNKIAEMANITDIPKFLDKTLLNQSEIELQPLKEEALQLQTHFWTITNGAFVVGGMIGAFTSKYVSDFFGRKKGIIFHSLFTIIGGILVFIAPYVKSPECVVISRLAYGIQGGMSCGIIPTYLSEISPTSLRGATGVMHQLFVTIGIMISQILGFRQILGVPELWHILLALPFIPAVLGAVLILLLFPETPRALLINNRDEESARKALMSLRNSRNVNQEIEAIKQEARESGDSEETMSFKDLFTTAELRWPLLTGLVLQLTQQLCGINAVFFYSEGIFSKAGIAPSDIQYAILLTGVVNVIATIIVVPLIDRLGRKPLLVYPMIVIILDFVLLTVFLIYQKSSIILSYLSILCIIIFIICFAVGLGPIPFIYVAECFRQDARSAALAICMFVNWMSNFVLTLAFPYMNIYLDKFVFLVFAAVVGLAVIIIFKKMPETKGRTIDEIMASFTGKRAPQYEESSGKLIGNTKV